VNVLDESLLFHGFEILDVNGWVVIAEDDRDARVPITEGLLELEKPGFEPAIEEALAGVGRVAGEGMGAEVAAQEDGGWLFGGDAFQQ